MLGHDYQNKIFNRLLEKEDLSGSFLFFGDAQIGKFSFALDLAHKLENNAKALSETLIISPSEEKGTIVLENIRAVKIFFAERPTNSKVRTIIINDANTMTLDAIDALLKIVEEPPEYGLIILISSDPDSLLPTLISRCKRVYFRRAKKVEIEEWLIKEHKINQEEAKKIASISFGRPGLALELVNKKNDPWKPLTKKEESFDFETEEKYKQFVKKAFIRLYNDKVQNRMALRELSKRASTIARHSQFWKLNKKIQLKSIPWIQ